MDLSNHFLLATAALEDNPLFSGSLIYVCQHNDDGAMGLIVNKPSPIGWDVVFAGAGNKHIPERFVNEFVMLGGPVQPDRGFVLHTPVGEWQSSLILLGENAVTTSRDIIDSLGQDERVDHAILTIGYASWEKHQLEKELARNAWLAVEADKQILFETPVAERYQAALAKLGVNPVNLMQGLGHA